MLRAQKISRICPASFLRDPEAGDCHDILALAYHVSRFGDRPRRRIGVARRDCSLVFAVCELGGALLCPAVIRLVRSGELLEAAGARSIGAYNLRSLTHPLPQRIDSADEILVDPTYRCLAVGANRRSQMPI